MSSPPTSSRGDRAPKGVAAPPAAPPAATPVAYDGSALAKQMQLTSAMLATGVEARRHYFSPHAPPNQTDERDVHRPGASALQFSSGSHIDHTDLFGSLSRELKFSFDPR